MSQNRPIILDRRIDIEWLDFAAAQAAAQTELSAARDELFSFLDEHLSGGRKTGTSCHKTVGILTRIWIDVPPELVGLRERAIALLPLIPPERRIALHWSMLLAGFPFFADLTGAAGRLLGLQGTVPLSQLTRRIREGWGERSTMKNATQRLTRSLVQWGALQDTSTRGVYSSSARVSQDPSAAALLLEALLVSRDAQIAFEEAVRHPSLFPFEISVLSRHLRSMDLFEVHRQGLDMDVVQMAGSNGGC